MVEQNNNQQGSTLLIVVIALLVIAGAGLGGWYVLNHKDKDSKTAKNNTSQQQAGDEKDAEDTPADPSEGGKYLVISEWGVRIPLSTELQGDVKYGISTAKDGTQGASFASKKLAAKSTYDGYCDIVPVDSADGTGMAGGTIAVSRSKTKSQDPDAQPSFSFNDYWYTLQYANGGACYEGDTGEEKGAFNQSMSEAVKQMQTVKE